MHLCTLVFAAMVLKMIVLAPLYIFTQDLDLPAKPIPSNVVDAVHMLDPLISEF